MTVNSLITIIFLVAIGTTFVMCSALPDIHRERNVKVHPHRSIKHKKNHDIAPDVLYRALSDQEVVPRSLYFPTMISQSNRNQVKKVENRQKNVLENLKLSVTFRDNIVYIFSYLLHGLQSGLTEEQYTSLQMLYDILRKKMVPMYNMLPILPTLQSRDKSYQTKAILLSLTKYLPSYLQCAATFLAHEIEMRKFDVNSLLPPPTKVGVFNYFTNISPDVIHKNQLNLVQEEIIGYDKFSNITQKSLGPVYVKLLYQLHTDGVPLSQELFGLILINLPNPKDDPILEEHIRYLYDLTNNQQIMNWNSIAKNVDLEQDAYTIVLSVLLNILNYPSANIVMKKAAIYVHSHLRDVIPTHTNPYFDYMYDVVKQDINVGLLLSAIVPHEFDMDAVRMKNRLLMYFMHNHKNKEIDRVMKGFNKYAYQDPLDLLLAFLTRMTDRVPTSAQNILQPATALLPALIMKKHIRTFTPFVSPDINVLILLESLKNPDLNPSLVTESAMYELIAQPQSSGLLNTLIPTDKSKCITPRQCLTNTMMQVSKEIKLPLTLTTKIQNIVHILKSTAPKPQSFSVITTDMTMDEVDTGTPIIIEMGNIPQGGISYVWDTNDYVGESDHIQEIETEREVINDVPYQTTFPQQPLTVNVSLTSTTSYVPVKKPSETGYQVIKKPRKKPQTIQPHEVPSIITEIPTKYTTETDHLHMMEEKQPSVTNETPQETLYNTLKVTIPTTKKPRVTLKKGKKKIVQTSPKVHKTTTPAKKSSESSESIEINLDLQDYSEENPSTTVKPIKNLEHTQIAMFPPSIKPDQPLAIQLSGSGVPVVTMGGESETVPGLELPEIKVLLNRPNLKTPLNDVNEPIVKQVLQPLSVMFGKNYVQKILKEINPKLYPTNIALLLTLFKKAKTLPQVMKNTELIGLIRKYIATMEYISPTILLPIVTTMKKLTSNVVYSTFNPHDATHSDISEKRPSDSHIASDRITIPIVNPKTWLQSINSSNPYADLIPTLPEGDPLAATLEPLKVIMVTQKITELLGPDFKPLAYPNRGALLITLLHKLRMTKMVELNISLKNVIDNYILAIELPSMQTQVSEDSLVKMMSESKGHWQPELTSLISALPNANNDDETAKIATIEQFLSDPNILENLHVEIPSSTMSRGEFLHKLILTALANKSQLDKKTIKALDYYRDKVEFNDMGALPIMWAWVEVYVMRAEIQLGSMIQQTVDFNKLAYKEKLAYNDVITYLAENPQLLQNNHDFEFEKYKTQGEFVKALFQYIMKKSQVNRKIKKSINMLLQKVKITGAGAVALPSFDKNVAE